MKLIWLSSKPTSSGIKGIFSVELKKKNKFKDDLVFGERDFLLLSCISSRRRRQSVRTKANKKLGHHYSSEVIIKYTQVTLSLSWEKCIYHPFLPTVFFCTQHTNHSHFLINCSAIPYMRKTTGKLKKV